MHRTPNATGSPALDTSVWVLEQARRVRATEAELLRSYPGLRAEDLANAWAYIRAHRDAIDAQTRDHEAA